MLNITIVGFGAIAESIIQRVRQQKNLRVCRIVVRREKIAQGRARLLQLLDHDTAESIAVDDAIVAQSLPHVVLECAGHTALRDLICPALESGIECAVLSVGALADQQLALLLAEAAKRGNTQLHLLAGAIGGIDAIAAAKQSKLSEVVYRGRKPPLGWKGSAAEEKIDLSTLRAPTLFFEGTAREAASQFPKNANVAATVALAGLGLDHTRVTLIADPTVSQNIHEIDASGDFGQITISLRGNPLAENPKTSALTVLSALRFLANRANHLTI